ncbi:MAG: zinc ribbon domain-containing protein, partial [Acidobacteria bacterium]|nr:zinc ribbon domain-containing protein [Acidobacteriota bacterium]
MDITFECGKCGQRLEADQGLAGTEAPCPNCGFKLRVPSQEGANAGQLTPTPLPAQSRKPGGRQIITGVVALVVLVGSLWAIWQNLRPQKPWSPDSARATPAGKPRTDWTVTDYRVWAEPVLWEEGSRVWSAARGTLSATGARRSRPAVRVHVELEAACGPSAPGLWPGATRVELWRSPHEQNGYVLVQALETADAASAIASTEPQRQSKDPSATRHYSYWLADTGAEAGRRYFYKVRYFAPRKKLLAETGHCSTVVVTVPAVEQDVDAGGHPLLRWAAAEVAKDEFVTPPRLVVRSAGNQELARLPWASGQFQVPLRIVGSTSGKESYTVTVLARLRCDEWRSHGGQTNRVVALEQEKQIDFPAPRVDQKAAGTNAPVSISVVPAGARSGWYTLSQAGPDSGAYGVMWAGPSQPKPSFERRSARAGVAGLSRYGGWLSYCEYPGLSERCTYTYAWESPETKAVHTAQVWAVRSPLPTGLFGVAGDREVHLRWDRLVYE